MSSPHRSGRDLAHDYLLNDVLTDPRNAGQFLSEQELAERLGISRTPVREAFLLLKARGLIEMIPNRGAMVPRMTGTQIRQLFEFRTVIESHSIRTSMERGVTPVIGMRALLEAQEDLVDLGDMDSSKVFIEKDRDFHMTLVRAAENHFMEDAYSTIRTRQLMVGIEALFRTPTRRADVCREHAEILEALAAGSTEQAVEATVRHLETTRELLLNG
ncbi:GntR family transcriptional regulator [Citricoccus sp. GCM10030269]|uniref:GntR family transcriptional regulator n=1 Tax=Citricoccus sp. GCM10030269 TaxID=3273388 RepID=UPI003619A9B7